MITWVNINGFLPNFVSALILWKSGFGLLMGKFCHFLTELSVNKLLFSFTFMNDNKGKYQQIFTKFSMNNFHQISHGVIC